MFIINILSGELCHRLVGPALPGPLAVNLSITYTSSSLYEGPLGIGWNAPYDMHLEKKGSLVKFRLSGDELDRFDMPTQPNHVVQGTQHSLKYSDDRAKRWAVQDTARRLTYELTDIGDGIHLTRITDPHENSIDIDRDKLGRIVSLTDAVGRQVAFSYEGMLIRQIELAKHGSDKVGRTLVQFGYNNERRMSWSSIQGQPRTEYSYDTGKLVACTGPMGGTTCAQYDSRGRCVKVWEQGGAYSRSFAYDAHRGATRVIDALGYSTLYRFDETGYVAMKVDAMGGVTEYLRDGNGSLMAQFDPLGNPAVVYSTDEEGRRLTKTLPNGTSTTFEFGAQGDIIAVRDAAGGRWAYERDANGKTRSVTTAVGHKWSFGYDDKGRFRSLTNPGEHEVVHNWSHDGRQHDITDPLGVLSETRYDSLGRMVAHRGRRGAEFKVSYLDVAHEVENVDGSTRRYEMDAAGNLVRFVDELGSSVVFHYSEFGRLIAMTDPTSAKVSWEYDAEGRVLSVTNANGDRLENARDPLGRVVRQTGFDGVERQYAYDAGGRLVSKIDGNGVELSIDPDEFGRPITRSYSDGSVVETEYGIGERLTRASDSGGALEFVYDEDYRLVIEKFENTEIIYEYDWHSHPVAILCGERHLKFKYDPRGDLSHVEEGDKFRISLDRNSDSTEEDLVFHTGLRIRRSFDARGRLAEQCVYSRAGSTILSTSYAYDERNNRTETQRSGREPLSFSHNLRGELYRVRRGGTLIREYDYDAAGNRLRTDGGSYDIGQGNRIRRSGPKRYDYDGEGRPVVDVRAKGELRFRYDARGRLVELESADDEISFSYDYCFRRRNKNSGDVDETTIWTGDCVFEQRLGNGTVLEYVMHPVHCTPLAVRVNDNWHAVVCDQRGEMTDVVRLRDEQVVWSSDALGYEWEVREGDDSYPIPIRGHGQQFDVELGYCYQRARYYDPAAGRFLMPDPIGFYGGLNLYQFCQNQPFLFTDPLGLAACPLSEDDCDDIFDDIERRSASVQNRWQDMVDNTLDLPWDGMPGKGQIITTAAVGAARGTVWAVGDASMGSIDSHITAHDNEQRGMQRRIQDYHNGGCSQYEDSSRAQAMQQHYDVAERPPSCPELGL